MPMLPEEIVDKIMALLDRECCCDLLHCALAGRPLLFPSRRYVPSFQDVWAFDCHALHRLRETVFWKRSTIRHHVKSLTVDDDNEGQCEDFTRSHEVTLVLQSCKSLVRLNLQFVYLRPFELPTFLFLTYLRLFEVSIYTPMHIVDLLSRFPALETVKLGRISYCDDRVATFTLPKTLRAVELHFNSWVVTRLARTDQLISWMALPSSRLPAIRRFNLYDVPAIDVTAIKVVLGRLRGCISSITVKAGCEEADVQLAEGGTFLHALSWYRNGDGKDVFSSGT